MAVIDARPACQKGVNIPPEEEVFSDKDKAKKILKFVVK